MKLKRINLLFIIIVGLIISISLFYSVFHREEINIYEKREAYTFKKFSLKTFFNKEFQDNVEDALSDQLPLTSAIKEKYNYSISYMSKLFSSLFIKQVCSNNYFYATKDNLSFGCTEVLISKPLSKSDEEIKDNLRLKNINELLNYCKKEKIDVFLYYIERYDDINFESNEKNGLYEKIKQSIATNNISRLELKSFDDYEEWFYKTDHHLNYKGSYYAYTQIASLMNLDDVMIKGNVICGNRKLSGDTANTRKVKNIYNEDMCIYDYDWPDHKTYINKKVGEYGLTSIDDSIDPSYVTYYGGNDAEIIFDYNQPNRKNFLVLGNSYDNAYIKLLATHFNKTYAVDIRYYKQIFKKDFNFSDYIKDNDIDIILISGDQGFFLNELYSVGGI